MELTQAPKVKSIACASCGAPIQIFAPDASISVGCSKCGSISSVSHDVSSIISKYGNKIKRAVGTDLPIGVKGKFRGKVFQVRGMIAKSDTSEGWWWQEYLLFNPYIGNRWLVCFRGHWTYFTPIKDKPEIDSSGLRAYLRGRKYLLHTNEASKVQYAVGEFYWEIHPEDKVNSRDFINAPEMLSEEKDGKEISWALGEYVQPEDIQKAFLEKPSNTFPKPSGTVAHQPFPAAPFLKKIGITALLFMIILFFAQIATLVVLSGRYLNSYSTEVVPSKEGTEFKFEPITIPDSKNLTVKYSSNVDNNWLELEADLVEVATGKSTPIDALLEYYHGYEGGESWREGSYQKEIGLRDIKSGEYAIAGTAISGASSPVKLEVEIRKNTPTWLMYIVFNIPLFIIAFLALIFRQGSYRARWNDSDYQEDLFGGSS